jgi:hypothetical protein
LAAGRGGWRVACFGRYKRGYVAGAPFSVLRPRRRCRRNA